MIIISYNMNLKLIKIMRYHIQEYQQQEKDKQFFRSLITTMSFLGHLQVIVFLYALLLFSAESRKTQLFDTESSADDGAEHENYGEKVY